MSKEKYNFILVNSKTFTKFLNIIKEKANLNSYEQKDNETHYVVNNFIVGFSKYYEDLKINYYYIHKFFIDLVEERVDE